MRFFRFGWPVLAVLVVAGLLRLRFDVEIFNLLPPNLDAVKGLKLYQQHFSNSRELIVTLEGPEPESVEKSAQMLAERLQKESSLVSSVTWRPIWQEHPADASELIAYLWLNQPPATFSNLLTRFQASNVADHLAHVRADLATSFSPRDIAIRGYDPFGLLDVPVDALGTNDSGSAGDDFFVSGDGTFRVMMVEARPDLRTYKECRAWLDAIKAVAAEMRSPGGIPDTVHIGFTGRPAFVTEIAGGMEADMSTSVSGTLTVIAILFYLTHRRILPMVSLLVMLLIVLLISLGLGGLSFGTLNVVSLGFAAILSGLAEDFAIVLYQEHRSHPELSLLEVRREAGPGIWGSAITTAGAFFLLNLSGLPGLAQLGTLIGIGILAAAVVMLYIYLPLIFRFRSPAKISLPRNASEKAPYSPAAFVASTRFRVGMTLVLLAGASAVVIWSPPAVNRSSDPLRPKNSEAYAQVEKIQRNLGRTNEPLWIIIPGRSEDEVRSKLTLADHWLDAVASNNIISSHATPLGLWPDASSQSVNRNCLGPVLGDQHRIFEATLSAGFSSNSLALTKGVFKAWDNMRSHSGVYWPTNRLSDWVMGRFSARAPGGFYAISMIDAPPQSARQLAQDFPPELKQNGLLLSGWSYLGGAVYELVRDEFPRVLIPTMLLALATLWITFRTWKDVMLSILVLAFSGLILAALMAALHWQWNMLNLVAIPLIIAMGIDYSVHVQLALRRYRGDMSQVGANVGKALLLAGSTTIAGFATLTLSQNAGMASLGQVCALGLSVVLLVSLFLLPYWWKLLSKD